MTKISGWPGTREVRRRRCTRPARSSGTPSDCASGEACTPAAQSTVRAAMRSLPTQHAALRRSRVDPARSVRTSTPSAPAARAPSPTALRDRRAGRRARPRAGRCAPRRGSMLAEVAAPGCAGRSPPARPPAPRRSGPPPTMTKVSQRGAAAPGPSRARPPRRRAARGGGSRARPRASSGPARTRSQSVVAEVGVGRAGGERPGSRRPARRRRASSLRPRHVDASAPRPAARSRSSGGAAIERMGEAMSLGFSAAVATW